MAIVCDRWRVAELREKLEGVNFPLAHLVERGQGFKDGGADVRDFRAAVLAGKVQAIALDFVERRNGRSAGNGRPERKLEIGETHTRGQAGDPPVMMLARRQSSPWPKVLGAGASNRNPGVRSDRAIVG